MPSTCDILHRARRNRDDEFYTLYKDVEKELVNYDFRGKTIVCPCNDVDKNFHKYFEDNFDKLGIKRLICVHYNPDPWGSSYYYDNGEKKPLKSNGDFRSEEVISLMKEGDYIITNPPFSLIRDFFEVIMSRDIKFLVLAPIHCLHYKNIFPYFRDNKIFMGYSRRTGGGARFEVPVVKSSDGKLPRVNGIIWLQNIKRYYPDPLDLTEDYSPEKYPKYDTLDCIEIDAIKNIPKDYFEDMGVSVYFFCKYNPDQFEILDIVKKPLVNGKIKFVRIRIKRKAPHI